MPNKTYNKVQLRVKFTQASERANIGNTDTNGENIAISFGKLSKWYEALVPIGGSSGKILAWNTAGTAKWSDPLHPSVTKSADTTSTASPAHGGTFTTVDTVTRDAYGHVTKINTKTITLPADSNTDTKVTQSQTTTSKYRPILFGAKNSTDVSTLADTITDEAYTSTKLYAQPSTGLIYCTGRQIKSVAIQTGSTKITHITLQTLMTWLITTKTYIPSGQYCHVIISTTWAYADNDILQVSIDGTNYEIQLAGVIIEFIGYAASYNDGMFRLLIHSSPTTSFTPASGYTKFPVSTIAEYTCNGSGYSPTWKKIWNSHPTYTSKSSGLYKITVDGTGHVSAATAVAKSDITALGIPGSDTNTTYTIATGDSNGQIKVTPSSGSAYNVSVKGLGSAAYTESTDYISSSTKIVLHRGNAGTSNMNDVGRLHASVGMTDLSDPGNNYDNPMNGTTKSTSWHLYWDASYKDDPNGSNSWVAQIVNKAGTAQWWVRSRKGGTITNGTEWAAGWEHLTITSQAGAGSATNPVYVDSNGHTQACTYSLNKSVPSNALFTDSNVRQSATTTTDYRPIVTGAKNTTTIADLDDEITSTVYTSENFFVQPSTGSLYATQFFTKSYLSGTGVNVTSNGIYARSYFKRADNTVADYKEYLIRTYNGKITSNDGILVSVGGGGLTIVGGGESSSALAGLISDDQTKSDKTTLNVGGTLNTEIPGNSEQLIMSSDENIYFITNCQTIANRKPVCLNTSSYFYPGTNKTGSIGTSSYMWNSVYAATIYENGTSLASKYAAIGHTHGLLHSDLTQVASNGTTGGWSVIGIDPAVNGYVLKSIRINTTSPDWLSGGYGAGIAFGGADTKGVISMRWDSPVITFAGGNHKSTITSPTWYFKISGTSGSTYNLDALNVGYVMSSSVKYDSHTRRFTSSKTDTAWNAQAYSNTGYADNVYVSFRAGQTTMYAMIGLDANPSEDANYDKIDYCWYIQNNGALKVYESGTSVTITGHTTYASGDEFRVEYSCGEIRYYHNGTMCRSVTRAVSGKLFFDSSFHNAGNVYDFSYGTSTHSTHTAEIITSTYKSVTYVKSLTSSVITLSDEASSFGGWICGPTKNGRIAISSYQGDNDKLYFGYGERGRTTNSYAKVMTWDGPTNTLTADKFVGALQGNADTATTASKLSNTSAIGSSTQPVYFNASGVPVACTQDANKAHFSTVPFVKSDGVMEVGRYFDMHSTNTGTTDWDVRLDASGVSSFRFTFNTPASSSIAPSTNNQTSLGTSSLKWSNVYATTFYGALSGNASTATKLETARNIALAEDFAGSADFDGSGNISISGTFYRCSASSNNTANYPWHRIAYRTGVTGVYNDTDAIFMIRAYYNGGPFGIIKVTMRTNGSGANCQVAARWLVRQNIAANDVYIAQWGKTGQSVYADIFLKGTTYNRAYVYQIAGSRLWTLVNSDEASDTTTSDKKTSTEVYASIAAAGTALHNQAYTQTVAGVDAGHVNSANSATYATRAEYVDVVASNEIRFYNDNQFTSNKHFWLGYSWAAGSHYTPSGGSDTSSTTAPNITKFVMGNCSQGGLASVHAKTFILGNGSSPTLNSKTTTIATAATTTDRTITLPDASGTAALLTKGSTSFWGLIDGDGSVSNWIRGTSSGFIPSAGAKFFQTATSSLGTNTWYFKNSYIQYMNANRLVLGAAKTADGAAKGQVKFFSGNRSDATGTVTLECIDDAVHTGDYTVKLPTWNGTIPIFEKLFEGASNTVSLSYSDINEYDVFLITVANSNATTEQVTVTSLWISNVAGIHDMPLIWGGAPASSGGACNVTSGWIQLSKNSGTTTFVVAHKPSVAQMTSSGWTISSPTYNLYIRKIFGLKAYKRT